MKTRWISLETAADILGVDTWQALALLTTQHIRTNSPKEAIEVEWDAQAIEELAKIRKARKP